MGATKSADLMDDRVALLLCALGGAVILARAKLSSSRPARVSRTHNPRAKVGSGRRSRFQDSEVPPIYCAPAAPEYHALVASMLRSDDVVLEIGCQLSAFTTSIAERCESLIGIDIDRKAPSTVNMRSNGFYRQAASHHGLANVELHIMEVWDLPELAAVCGRRGVTLVVVDVNAVLGNDLPFEVLALVRTLCRLLSPRVCVVKSRSLAALQHRLRPAPLPPAPSRPLGVRDQQRVMLIAADLVHDYRQAAFDQLPLLPPGACGFEIGCHVGATTALLDAALSERGGGGACVGVDVSEAIVARARKLHPTLAGKFEVADAWDVGSLLGALERCAVRAPSVLMLDVGGLSGANGALDALALIRVLCAVFHETLRLLVIKSSCLRTLALALKPASSGLPAKSARRPSALPDRVEGPPHSAPPARLPWRCAREGPRS